MTVAERPPRRRGAGRNDLSQAPPHAIVFEHPHASTPLSVSAYIAIEFAEPIAIRRHRSPDYPRTMSLDLSYCGFTLPGGALGLIDRYRLPRVSPPHALLDWSRRISEAEYLELIGPPDLDALAAKHRGLRFQLDWRKEPGHENHYGQVENVFALIEEFRYGNRALSYTLTVSDMG